jgi:hypothetical protein
MTLANPSGWQSRLPPPLTRGLAMIRGVRDAWRAAFMPAPPKTDAQLRLERRIQEAVLSGELHWQALDDVKKGRPLDPALMADSFLDDTNPRR